MMYKMLRNFSLQFLTCLLLLFIGVNLAHGQKIKEQLAEKYISTLDYPRAVSVYEDIVASGKANAMVYRQLAAAYLKLDDREKAQTAYAKLMNDGFEETDDLIVYADILRSNGKYEEAMKWYEDYNVIVPGNKRVEAYLKGDIFTELMGDSASTIHLVDINSRAADLGLTVMDDLLVFSSSRGEGVGGARRYSWDKQPYLNLYTAILEGQKPSDPLVMRKDLNSRYHDGTVTFDSLAQRIYFTRNNIHYGVRTIAEDGELKLGIYYTDITEGPYGKEWSPLIPFEHNNPEFNYGQPCISKDGKMLFFVSDMKGGYGGTDLYKCDNISGSWGVPQNLGPRVNTSGNEMHPFYDADDILYFASDGHPGLGGMDMFLAPNDRERFGNAYNLNYPVNTRFNENGLILNKGNEGFLVSDRTGGKGSDDIYGLTLAKPMVRIRGTVVNKLTRMPIKNPTVLVNALGGQAIERSSVITHEDGTFEALVEFQNAYQIIGAKTGFFQKELDLEMATANLDSVVLELLKYDYGAEGIVTQGETELPLQGATVQLLDENDSLIMEVLTDENGKYMFPLEAETNYRVKVEKEGFFKQSARLSTRGKNAGVLYTDFRLFELELDKVVRLDNIYYDLAKWNIRPDAGLELDKLVQTLWDNPTVKLELSAHTDCRGGDAYNMGLSKKRANSAVEYIISKGVPKDRIISKGYGETDPVANCSCNTCTEEQHQYNRRTQFKVLEF